MAVRSRGLGKGLDSLIPNAVGNIEAKNDADLKNNDGQEVGSDILVKITMIEPNREQPRKNFDEDSLLELAESIKQYGLLQPILVQDRKSYYEIVAGERRWRAAKMAGLKEVPEFNLKQDEVAERVSKSRTAVTNSMRLLKLCDEVQQMIIDDMITTGHARALITIEDPEQQYTIAQKIFDEKLSVRDVEKLVKNLNSPPKIKKVIQTDKALEVIYQDMEEKLKQSLGTKVIISPKGGGSGKLEIEFYNHDDLEKITDKLTH